MVFQSNRPISVQDPCGKFAEDGRTYSTGEGYGSELPAGGHRKNDTEQQGESNIYFIYFFKRIHLFYIV